MFKSTGRHTRMPREARWVGPMFAYQAVRLALAAKKEMLAASSAQRG
jgi:hypothetical protein